MPAQAATRVTYSGRIGNVIARGGGNFKGELGAQLGRNWVRKLEANKIARRHAPIGLHGTGADFPIDSPGASGRRGRSGSPTARWPLRPEWLS